LEAQPEETIAKAHPGSRMLALKDADLLSQGNELQSESCHERKKAPNFKERKAGRSRIMGPVYMTQSTGGRVPASG